MPCSWVVKQKGVLLPAAYICPCIYSAMARTRQFRSTRRTSRSVWQSYESVCNGRSSGVSVLCCAPTVIQLVLSDGIAPVRPIGDVQRPRQCGGAIDIHKLLGRQKVPFLRPCQCAVTISVVRDLEFFPTLL